MSDPANHSSQSELREREVERDVLPARVYWVVAIVHVVVMLLLWWLTVAFQAGGS